MLPLQSFAGLDRYSNHTKFLPLSIHVTSSDRPPSTSERRSTDACRSHKEAERRRRQRINAHLSTLRSLLPDTTKTDKASLLAEVVRRVRELRRQADDLALQLDQGCGLFSEAGTWPFPGEHDEVAVTCMDGEARLVKATVCCEDRPGLNWDLSRAIGAVRGRAVRTEMATMGGRTRTVVLVQTGGGEERLEALRGALKDVMENRVSDSGLAHVVGTKRSRVYGSGRKDDHQVVVG